MEVSELLRTVPIFAELSDADIGAGLWIVASIAAAIAWYRGGH